MPLVSTIRVKGKLKAVIPILLLLFGAGFYPLETVDVPAWKLRIVNERGTPYAGIEVTQAWKNYTLETQAGQNFDTRITDNDGYVEFPERRTRASVTRRVFLTIYSALMKLAHGGFGVHAYVHASGPTGYRSVDYTPGKPPPAELVLPTR
jgi:hypothetical protein